MPEAPFCRRCHRRHAVPSCELAALLELLRTIRDEDQRAVDEAEASAIALYLRQA